MAPVFPRPYGAPTPRHQLPTAPPQIVEGERSPSPARRYTFFYLDEMGDIEEVNRMAPAHPGFEASCGAFAHGTLIATDSGPVAIEDLLPGTMIQTRDADFQRLDWIGSITLVPHTSDTRVAPAKLTRITENSVGLGKPERDIVFGPHARILRRNPVCQSLFGTDAAFAPVNAFIDGVSIIEVAPVSPVRVFHLGLDGQHVIFANGLEVESFHPGRSDATGVPPMLMSLFFEMFPWINNLNDFGQMRVPRLSGDDIRALESA